MAVPRIDMFAKVDVIVGARVRAKASVGIGIRVIVSIWHFLPF